MLTPELVDEDYKKLINVIREVYQLDFSNYALNSFKRRIDRLIILKKLGSIGNLIDIVEQKGFSKDYLLEEITVNVTEMFRDPLFWVALKKIIPSLFLNTDQVKIWHAGCSTGEEVFSMAILLKEMNLLHKCKVVASDISPSVLQNAATGKVPMKNMELNSKNYSRVQGSGELLNHFTIKGENAFLHKEYIESVSFRNIDLVKASPFLKFDLILCRNVLIYFDRHLQERILKFYHQSLFNYSYLALGLQENFSWSNVYSSFITVNNEAKLYKKVKE